MRTWLNVVEGSLKQEREDLLESVETYDVIRFAYCTLPYTTGEPLHLVLRYQYSTLTG